MTSSRVYFGSFIFITLVGCIVMGADGRAVKIKKAYMSPPADEIKNNTRADETLNEKKFPGRMDADFDVISDEAAFLASLEQTGVSETCGRRPVNPPPHDWIKRRLTRVVAGIESTRRWPWQVALLNSTSKEPFCGGTLIGRDHIITAAHCFDNEENENNILILLGEHDRTILEGTEQEFSIDCIHIHRRYRYVKQRYINDIAIVKLRTSPGNDVVINDYVMPACLADKNEFKAGDLCFVTGWGYTNFTDYYNGQRPTIINQARLPILSHDACQQTYGSFISKRMVCAGYLDGEQRADTCKGDSGGPLVCQQVDGRWKLVGVTSWGKNFFCIPSPTDAAPGVYTRVDRYRKWIQKQLDMKKCRKRRAPLP